MKRNHYKLITTHSLVVAVFTNTWLLAFVFDAYSITTGSQQTPSGFVDTDLADMLSFVSLSALVISLLSFVLYLADKKQ